MTRDLILMGLSLSVWGVGEGMFTYFQPLYLQKLGANAVTIGAILGLVLVIMFALYLPQPLTPNFLQSQRHLSLSAIGQLGSIGNLGNAMLMLSLGHLDSLLAIGLGQAAVADVRITKEVEYAARNCSPN